MSGATRLPAVADTICSSQELGTSRVMWGLRVLARNPLPSRQREDHAHQLGPARYAQLEVDARDQLANGAFRSVRCRRDAEHRGPFGVAPRATATATRHSASVRPRTAATRSGSMPSFAAGSTTTTSAATWPNPKPAPRTSTGTTCSAYRGSSGDRATAIEPLSRAAGPRQGVRQQSPELHVIRCQPCT